MPTPATDAIDVYAAAYPPAQRAICTQLRALIDNALPKATSKVWHGAPVWSIGPNPVVGYSVQKRGVQLLFWNGKAFNDAALTPVGKYFAAELMLTTIEQIKLTQLRRLLKLAKANVFDGQAHFAKLRAAARKV
jgi:hypothetical protein